MYLDKILKPGDEVRIRDDKGAFVTRVDEVNGEDSFTAAAPTEPEHLLMMKPGARLLVSCVTERGLYLFEASAGEPYHVENVAMVTFTAISDIKRIQRRDAFRVRESVPVSARKKPQAGEAAGKWLSTGALDISEGGMLLKFSEPCQPGEVLELVIRINNFGIQEILPRLEGKVVRCVATGNSKFGYSLGIRFQALPEKARSAIIKLVVLSQRSKLTYQYTKRYR